MVYSIISFSISPLIRTADPSARRRIRHAGNSRGSRPTRRKRDLAGGDSIQLCLLADAQRPSGISRHHP